MKKTFTTLALLLSICTLIGGSIMLQTLPASAEGEVSVNLSDAEIHIDEDCNVYINVGEVTDLNGVEYIVNYDHTVFTFDNVTSGLLDGTTVGVTGFVIVSPGQVKVLQQFGLSSINGSGYLAILHFNPLKTGVSPVTLTAGILSGIDGEIPATWTGGTAEVLEELPMVGTLSADKYGATTATLHGTLDYLGTALTANVSFEWGTSPGSYSGETTPASTSDTGAFSFKLTGLSGNTTFYYRAKAAGDGTAYGTEASFTTLTSGCFIATAAYGSYLDEYIDILRHFRDRYLITNGPGLDFVNFYYTNSPPIARFISEHAWLKPPIRAALMPVVVMADIVLKVTPVGALAIIGFLAVIVVGVIFRMSRRQKKKTA
jgi:hypothetical protein